MNVNIDNRDNIPLLVFCSYKYTVAIQEMCTLTK